MQSGPWALRNRRYPLARHPFTAALTVALLFSGMPLVAAEPALALEPEGTIVFDYTGAVVNWTVPAGVTSIEVEAIGAAGGDTLAPPGTAVGGLGGHVIAVLPVTPGESLQVRVGGRGGDASRAQHVNGVGGFNGGGTSPSDYYGNGAGGGGASDVRRGAFGLADRTVVAGGGGGAGELANLFEGQGGSGGGPTAQAGMAGPAGTLNGARGGGGGAGGGPGAGGAGGAGAKPGGGGVMGLGGGGGNDCETGGGGGGGHYGGGGGAGACGGVAGGGGGGSNHTSADVVLVQDDQGFSSGHGEVVLRLGTQEGNGPATGSAAFEVTNTTQRWTVPDGVTSILVDAQGGAGGSGPVSGGRGGRVEAIVEVTPGQELLINVGGQGGAEHNDPSEVDAVGGFNGGGRSDGNYYGSGGGGGGASDIRRGSANLGARVAVAAGGGGTGNSNRYGLGGHGGGGGGVTGNPGGAGVKGTLNGAYAGTPGAPGAEGSPLGRGGEAASGVERGGGGGGGYFGGGAGGAGNGGSGGGGGGGSSHPAPASGVRHTPATNPGPGRVVISYPRSALPPAPLLGGPLTPAEVLGGSNPSQRCAQAIRCHADPVDTSTGNFFETFDDLSVAGRGIPLSFRRTYNAARAALEGPLGFGWTHSYDMALSVSGTRATIRQENASEVAFVQAGTAWVPAAPRVLASLARNADGTWTFTRRNREIIIFDAAGALMSLADRNGATTTLAYPDPDTVVVADPAGRTLTLAHIGGRLRSVTDPMGRAVGFDYDAAGDLVEVTDVAGGRATFSYDAGHRMVSKYSPRFADDTTTSPAPEVTNTYDEAGRVVSQRDQIGRATTFDYTTIAGSVIVTDPKANATLDTYEQGVLVSQTKGYASPEAATWQFRYDPRTVGVVSVTDPAGQVSSSTYDAAGNRTSSTDALGRTTTATFNSFDQPLTVTDAEGITTTATYDPAGNPTSVSTPLLGGDGAVSATRTTTYHHDDPAHPSDVTSLIDPRGKTWTFAYSATGDLRSTTALPTPENPAGATTTVEHNAIGWTTATISPRGNLAGADPFEFRTTFDHDDFGRPVVVRSPLWDPSLPEAHQRSTDYDPDGNVVATVDGEANATTFDYDPAGQLLAEHRADATTLSYGYWPDGSLASRTDGAGASTSYAYDAQGRPTTTTDPLGRASTTTYDAVGNPVSSEDPGGDCGATPKQGCTSYTYDEANQLVAIDYADPATPDVTDIDYDVNGRRSAMVDGTGTSSWDWDSLGRLEASTDGAGATVAYGYDLANNVTSIDYPGAGSVTRTYDDAGRWESVSDWLANTTTFAYDADSNLVAQAYPNATTATFGFDPAGRLEDIAHAPASAPSEPFAAFAYTRNGNDALASVASTGVSPDDHGYVYDELSRLAGVDDTTLAYDAADNLTQLADDTFQGFDAANQLCYAVSAITPEAASTGNCATPPAGATTFAYDARGNRTSATPPTGSSSTYAYDQANRLVAATAPGATTAVAAGAGHSLALRSDASVAAWGDNASGQLGDATTLDRLSATPVTGITGASAIAAGSRHSLAVVASGEVRAWGDNTSGKLGDDTTTIRLTPVTVTGLSGTTAVAAGANHSLALRSDGTVWAWGRNTSGQLGDGSTTARKTPVAVPGVSDVVAIAAGYDHSLALRGDGSVVAWGLNDFGQLGDGTTTNRLTPVTVPALSGATAVAAGARHSLALRSDGSVWTWGRNANGQLGDGTTTSRVSPAAVATVSGADAIAAGANHSLASTGAGALAWGRNDFGQLGDGSVLTRRTPVVVTGLTGAEALAAGPTHSMAAAGDGATASWGRNDQGQLGDGSLANRSIPGDVEALTGGEQTSYAYDGDGLRRAKTTAQATTAFTWDRSGGLPLLLAETTATATTRYLYGPGDMPLARIDAAGEVVYYHGDQLGSTRTLSDAAGEVVASATYDPYGEPSASSGIAQPFGFAGQYTDAETGLQYLRTRYYDPATGQFLTRDPLVGITGQPYTYANNSPLNYTDPTGEIAWLAVAAVVWAVAEVVSTGADAVSTVQTFTDPCASGWDKAVSGGLFAAGAITPGGGYSTGARGLSSRAARRQAMREQGIPTSQQSTSQLSTNAGYQYTYDVPDVGGGTRRMVVTQQTTDRVQGHGPHWEAGPVKHPERLDPLGRLRVDNTKSKVNYVE